MARFRFTCECGGDGEFHCHERSEGGLCLFEATQRPLLYQSFEVPFHAPAPMTTEQFVLRMHPDDKEALGMRDRLRRKVQSP